MTEPLELTITDFIRHPDLLNDNTNSIYQNAILKSMYGDELTEDELNAYKNGTGRQTYAGTAQNECTVVAGRKGGKTSRIAGRVATYQACCDHGIPRGERGEVMLIAPTLIQAKLAFDYILKDFQSSPVLDSKIQRIREQDIQLKDRITIRCVPCSSISVRGSNVISSILDEFGFFRNESTSLHCDREILNALRPAMITFPNRKLIKITTPGAKRGVAWEEYMSRAALPYPVWQVSTMQLNPNVPAEELEKVRQSDPEQFKREYLGEFTDSLIPWIQPEALLPCIVKNRTELRYSSGVQYSACIDPGFRHSDFSMAISHRTGTGQIVLDFVGAWTGTKQVPLAFGRAIGELAEILRRYNITTVVGDQYDFVPIQSALGEKGISYKEMTFQRSTRAQIFNNLRYLIHERRFELLDHAQLLEQLRALEVEECRDGNIDVRPGYGKDDMAVAVAMTAFELSQRSDPVLPSVITTGRASRPWDDDPRFLSLRPRDDDYFFGGYYRSYF